MFEDLENYSNEPQDGGVIAKVDYKKSEVMEIDFTVEAMQVVKKSGREQARDEL